MFYEYLDRMNNSYLLQHTVTRTLIYPKLHKSTRGLVLGAIMIAASISPIITLHFFDVGMTLVVHCVYYSESTFYSIIAIIVATRTYVELQPLRMHASEGTAVDRHILWLSCFGAFIFGFLAVGSAFYALYVPISSLTRIYFHYIDLMNSMITLMDICVQSLVIVNIMHRAVRTRKDVEKKPGRGNIAFLLCLDLSLWIVNTFHIKEPSLTISELGETSTSSTLVTYQSTYVLQKVAKPFIVLFRFHSTVCLSLAWTDVYEIPRGTQLSTSSNRSVMDQNTVQ